MERPKAATIKAAGGSFKKNQSLGHPGASRHPSSAEEGQQFQLRISIEFVFIPYTASGTAHEDARPSADR